MPAVAIQRDSAHPNFPDGLDVKPLRPKVDDQADLYNTAQSVEQYGIAGRVWYYFLSNVSPPWLINGFALKGGG